jgi:hypothetical protein
MKGIGRVCFACPLSRERTGYSAAACSRLRAWISI